MTFECLLAGPVFFLASFFILMIILRAMTIIDTPWLVVLLPLSFIGFVLLMLIAFATHLFTYMSHKRLTLC